MFTIPVFSRKGALQFLLLFFLLLIFSIIKEVAPLFVITLALWSFLLLYSIDHIRKHITLFCFLVSFFVFLLGREVCFAYIDLELYYIYLMNENDMTFLCLITSLLGILIGYMIKQVKTEDDNEVFQSEYKTAYIRRMQKFLKMFFFFTYVFLIVRTLLQILFVAVVGYLGSYMDSSGGAGIPGAVSYVAAFCPTVFCLFLATKPSKKEIFFPVLLYELYAILSLFTGSRFAFMGSNMLLLIYFVIRDREDVGWLPRNIHLYIMILMPFLVFFLGAINFIRVGKAFEFTSAVDSLIYFLDSQGGSINVIKRVMYYESHLHDMFLCSFSNVKAILFENLIARTITGAEALQGNSIYNAFYGNSLMHRLSYYEYGNNYIQGAGVGSCYIAELYHDFGLFGVFVGSVFYGYIIRAVAEIKLANWFKSGLLLSIMFFLLHAPRAPFDEFVGRVFGIYALIGYGVIKLASILIRFRVRKKIK